MLVELVLLHTKQPMLSALERHRCGRAEAAVTTHCRPELTALQRERCKTGHHGYPRCPPSVRHQSAERAAR